MPARGPASAMGRAMHGLSEQQQGICRQWLVEVGALKRLNGMAATTVLTDDGHIEFIRSAARKGDTNLEGWSIYRQPTTINPPTTLRLMKRDGHGNLQQVISVTENGKDIPCEPNSRLSRH